MPDFDNVADTFIGYYDTTRGKVRELLTRENLIEYLPASPAQALDLGGGDGRDSEWLAELGHSVTWVDPSLEMFQNAQDRFRGSSLPITLRQLEPTEVERTLPAQTFDVVLSHGVLMYCIDDPEAHIRTISQLAKPGAIISVLTKGYAGTLDRFLSKSDVPGVQELMATEQCVNNLEKHVWAFKPEHVQELLGKYALELLEWRGVRVATDHDRRRVDTIPQQEWEQIMESERFLGQEPSTRGLGQMLHYIARKV